MARETREGLPTSQRRIEANRRNSQRSTGPRTAAGKNIVRRNALQHGLTAEKLVVVGEDAAEFQAMADAHHADIQPRNSIELELCKTFTLAAWRRQRCALTEAAMTNQYIRDSRRAKAVERQHEVLSLGERLFHDSQGLWRSYPDVSIKIRRGIRPPASRARRFRYARAHRRRAGIDLRRLLLAARPLVRAEAATAVGLRLAGV